MSSLPMPGRHPYADAHGAPFAAWPALAVLAAVLPVGLIIANLSGFGGIERMLEGVYPTDPTVWPGFTT
jgi:hypothetical protein